MPPESYSQEQCKEWLTSAFKALGFTDIDTWSKLDNKTYDGVKRFGAIYIGGGNTFFLLNELRRTDFIDHIKAFIEDSGMVYGGSAGAIIFGKTIRLATVGKCSDENKVGLTDLSALNMANGYDIHCHYEDKDDKQLISYSKKNRTKVMAIPEKSAVFVNGKEMTVIGYEPVYVFDGKEKKTFKPGTKIQ